MKIQTPTREEVHAAHDAITGDGQMADLTLALTVIARSYPELRTAIERIAPLGGIGEAAATALLTTGLNYGLRIGEARCNAIREKR